MNEREILRIEREVSNIEICERKVELEPYKAYVLNLESGTCYTNIYGIGQK
jgi:hypothetical protein